MKPNVNLSRKKLAQIPLSEPCKQVILGSLLGDGSLKIEQNSKNARLTIKYSSTQKEYLDWISSFLTEISSPCSIQTMHPTGFSKNLKLNFQSRALETLTEIHSITCPNKNLRIRRRWLNHMTPLSLAVWYLDDGSLIGDHRKAILCTEGFDKKSVDILVRYLNTVWGLNCSIAIKTGKAKQHSTPMEYYTIRFGVESTKQLLLLILPSLFSSGHQVPESMLYKFLIVYKSPLFQQRWISEMKHVLKNDPGASSMIDLAYQNKIKKLQKMI